MKKTVFIHIPKVAGISIECSLRMKRLRDLSLIKKVVNENGIISFGHNALENLLKHKYTKDFVSNAFTFAFVRNPYDRMISMYFYARKTIKEMGRIGFEDYCLKAPTLKNVMHSQTFWINPGVDFVGRYENLQTDFNKLCDKIGVTRRKLPKYNRTKHDSWEKYYTVKTESLVYHQYREDFINFNYERNNLLHRK